MNNMYSAEVALKNFNLIGNRTLFYAKLFYNKNTNQYKTEKIYRKGNSETYKYPSYMIDLSNKITDKTTVKELEALAKEAISNEEVQSA